MKAAKHWRSCVIVELPKPPNTVRALLRGRPVDHACPCRKSDPDVLVVETAENRPRKNPANGMNRT
jgi:hypothetical protein